jgi:hypothetical protein
MLPLDQRWLAQILYVFEQDTLPFGNAAEKNWKCIDCSNAKAARSKVM